MKEYSIVIPAFNEADKISSTINQVLTFMRGFAESFEVIVSDDGSKDNTADITESFLEENPELILLKNPHKGKGATVWAGVDKAQGEYIYLCDSDLSTPISELKKLSVWARDQGYDIVIGSREGIGAQRIGEPFYRHFIGRIFNFFVQAVLLPGINDSQCGFKLFNKKSAKDIFSRLKIYGPDAPVLEKAYLGAWDVEVLYLARKLKYKIKEVPVIWTFVKTTRLNFFETSIKMVRDVIKVRINDIRGVYKI